MNGIDPITGQPSESIANTWLPHSKFRLDERIPIQVIKNRMDYPNIGTRIKTPREECNLTHKGFPWNVYFRHRKGRFLISLQ